MPQQFLAIEWDARECRVAVAALRSRQVVIEQAFAVPRTHGDDSAEALGLRIAQELDARSCGRPEAMVCVGRTRIELRQFTVPPAPDDDLPDVVRFQAAREFNELDDRWRLDFLPIETVSEGPRHVLATAIAPAEIAEIEKVCEKAGLTLRRILLRPCEAASLLSTLSTAKVPQILIEIFTDEVNLTVLSGGKTVFLRTTRFAGDRPPVPALIAEIRLTLAAARNQLNTVSGESAKIESLVLCGRDPSDAKLAEAVKAELGMTVSLLDPFAGLATGPALAGALPDHADRFAPLLGILQAELRGSGHAVNFLNPRKRPEPVSRRNLWIALGSAAAALVVLYLVWSRVSHYMLASRVDELQLQVKQLEETLNKGKPAAAKTAEIAKLVNQETIWIDELAGFTRGMPSARDVMLSELTVSSGPLGNRIDAKGWTRTYETIAEMEKGVRPYGGKMNSGNSRQDPAGPYSWRFDATVEVDPEVKKDAKSSAANGQAPAKSPATGAAP